MGLGGGAVAAIYLDIYLTPILYVAVESRRVPMHMRKQSARRQ